MSLDPSHPYIYRLGTDNQYRVYWKSGRWHYEFLAGGVVFDDQDFYSEEELSAALALHGMTLSQFSIDYDNEGQSYSEMIKTKMKQLSEFGIEPCPKHGLSAKNLDNSCEACAHTDYPDDFKGTEG